MNDAVHINVEIIDIRARLIAAQNLIDLRVSLGDPPIEFWDTHFVFLLILEQLN